jgi:hypothetical protein
MTIDFTPRDDFVFSLPLGRCTPLPLDRAGFDLYRYATIPIAPDTQPQSPPSRAPRFQKVAKTHKNHPRPTFLSSTAPSHRPGKCSDR